MAPPLVSCLVPVYNGANYLAETLSNIVEQTWPALEIVVLDDGSSDDSAEIADSFGDPVRVVRAPHTGLSGARNQALAEAKADFIAYQDADDLWHPEKIARQMAAFDSSPDAGIVRCYAQNFWIDEIRHEADKLTEWQIVQPVVGYTMPACIVRRRVFDEVGRFNESMPINSDKEWHIRASDVGIHSVIVEEVLHYRRIHHSNLTRRAAETERETMIELVRKRLDRSRADSSG